MREEGRKKREKGQTQLQQGRKCREEEEDVRKGQREKDTNTKEMNGSVRIKGKTGRMRIKRLNRAAWGCEEDTPLIPEMRNHFTHAHARTHSERRH